MKKSLIIWALVLGLTLLSCREAQWRPGMPLAKEEVMVGVIHISNPFDEDAGYAVAHQNGIWEMQEYLNLRNDQLLYRINIDYSNPQAIESAMRELIARGANIIVATSWGYMDACEQMAREYPGVVFAHASGYRNNDTNFTNYFGRVYQARYLSGVIAGLKTQTNRIGYVAAWGRENSEVTGGINAFAMGVERVNPEARVLVKVTHSWFDPMGETQAARDLIAAGCDILAQHVDTANPQIEAQRAGVWGIGYNTDMSHDAPEAVITSVLWHWGAYYIHLVESIMDGSFSTEPWYGSLADGIIDLSPISSVVPLDPATYALVNEERRRIETEELILFSGPLRTNEGATIGRAGAALPDFEVQFGIDWYYHTVEEL
ncbi:MAG: BMP family ABC transporter substrate-binding protein [Treponema sp.]|nr:BMP family ABC transporter substrate-binding protein [Treponema sp.]